MLSNALFFFGLAIVATQAASIDNIKIANPADLEQKINNAQDMRTVVEAILRLLNVEHIEEILCVLDVASVFDKQEATDNLDTILYHGPELINLINERNELLKECRAIGGEKPSWREVFQRAKCINDVELSTGAQISIHNLQFQSAINYFRDIANDLENCAEYVTRNQL